MTDQKVSGKIIAEPSTITGWLLAGVEDTPLSSAELDATPLEGVDGVVAEKSSEEPTEGSERFKVDSLFIDADVPITLCSRNYCSLGHVCMRAILYGRPETTSWPVEYFDGNLDDEPCPFFVSFHDVVK